MVYAIRDPNGDDLGVLDKRLCIIESEFSGVLKVMMRKGSTVSELIRQSFDGGALNILTKNSPQRCSAPHVSIIGHVTAADLRRHLDDTDVSNGFLNRFPVCYSTRSKLLPQGARLEDFEFATLTSVLAANIEFAKKVSLMQRDQLAKELWDQVYADLTSEHPGIYGALTARGPAHVLRLSMIAALLDRSYWIRREHLMAALEIWRYCCDSVRFIFGDGVGDRVTDQILGTLRQNPGGRTRSELYNSFGRNESSTRIELGLKTLEKLGMAERDVLAPANGKGRPIEIWRALNHRGKT